jgi:hypothetical protein
MTPDIFRYQRNVTITGSANTVNPAYKDVLLLYLIRIIEAFLEIGALTS